MDGETPSPLRLKGLPLLSCSPIGQRIQQLKIQRSYWPVVRLCRLPGRSSINIRCLLNKVPSSVLTVVLFICAFPSSSLVTPHFSSRHSTASLHPANTPLHSKGSTHSCTNTACVRVPGSTAAAPTLQFLAHHNNQQPNSFFQSYPA